MLDEIVRVAMGAVGVERMVGDHHRQGRPRTAERVGQPFHLGVELLARAEVAVEGQDHKPGWVAPHVHAVPLGRHPPAGAAPPGIGELHLLAATVVVVVVITEHRVAGAVEDRFGIDVFEGVPPALRIDGEAVRSRPVEVVSQKEQRVERHAGLLEEPCHRTGDGVLELARGAEVADREQVDGVRGRGRRGCGGGPEVQGQGGARTEGGAE